MYDDYLKIVRPEDADEKGRSEQNRKKAGPHRTCGRKLPRKLRRVIRCVREHGLRYTFERIMDKLKAGR